MFTSPKSISKLLIEASAVGVILLFIFAFVMYIYNKKTPDSNTVVLLVVSGGLSHLLFEYSGLNQWYSVEYCKLVKP